MIRADIVKLYKTVHTWIGITCGFALFIAFYAGALTMFKDPIARWASPPAQSTTVPLGDAQRLVDLVAAAQPQARKEGIAVHLQGHDGAFARVTWEEDAPQRAGEPPEDVHWRATFAPDGTLVATRDAPSELGEFISELHMRAGLPDPWGSYFMGTVSLLYGVTLIAGVIVLLPSLVKDFLALRVGHNLKRMWLDAHNIVGVTALPFHIVIAVTATAWGFGNPLWDAQESVIFAGKQAAVMRHDFVAHYAAPRATGEAASMMTLTQLLGRLKEQAPDFRPSLVVFRNFGDKAAAATIEGTERGYVGDTTFGGVIVSAVSGRILKDNRPSRQAADRRTSTVFYGLHTGEYGGRTVTWAYFLLGFSGAWLFYSGNLLWIETRRKRSRDGGVVKQTRSTRLLGSATVGVCLGCVAGLSLTIVATKWLHGHVTNLSHWHALIYDVVFLGSIAWAFVRGAARSATHLLWLCSAATIAIPLTTLIALRFPTLGMRAYSSTATLGVDVVALLGAFCFACMALATHRRIQSGPVDSIWSIRENIAVARTARR